MGPNDYAMIASVIRTHLDEARNATRLGAANQRNEVRIITLRMLTRDLALAFSTDDHFNQAQFFAISGMDIGLPADE